MKAQISKGSILVVITHKFIPFYPVPHGPFDIIIFHTTKKLREMFDFLRWDFLDPELSLSVKTHCTILNRWASEIIFCLCQTDAPEYLGSTSLSVVTYVYEGTCSYFSSRSAGGWDAESKRSLCVREEFLSTCCMSLRIGDGSYDITFSIFLFSSSCEEWCLVFRSYIAPHFYCLPHSLSSGNFFYSFSLSITPIISGSFL